MIQQEPSTNSTDPVIIPRAKHSISRKDISREALKVLYRLHRQGFKGYLVGGAVRDLYLKVRPKDFDIATDARPNRLRKIFRNCRVIGKRFRLVHVLFSGNNCVEVSTFRRSSAFALKQENGLILCDNTFGTPEEDAKRRDLTINGLFYDIGTFSILDYVGGVADLKKGIIRTIAEPVESFREDPVRMIRALRHGARLNFAIDDATHSAILKHKELITYTNPSRLAEEIYRDLRAGSSERFFRLIAETGLMTYLFPDLARQLSRKKDHALWGRLRALDQNVGQGREYANTVLATVLLHTVILPPQMDGKEKASGDVGKLVNQNLRSLRAHFRLSLHACNRVVQIIMARRKLTQLDPEQGLPRSLLGKSYLPEALAFHEIIEAAEERPLETIQKLLRQAESAQRPKRANADASASGNRRPRRGPRRGKDGEQKTEPSSSNRKPRRRRARR